jgi:hypothetical protein
LCFTLFLKEWKIPFSIEGTDFLGRYIKWEGEIMKKFLILAIVLSCFVLNADETTGANETQLKEKAHDPLRGKNLDATEKDLNAKILSWNEALKNHSKLLVAKIKLLPKNTVLYKGTLNGEECVTHQKNEKTGDMELVDQENPQNNCLKLEIFDFVEGKPKKPAFGPKTKYMIIGFESDPSGEKNPRNAAPRNVKFIRSSVLVDNLYANDRMLVEVVDENPLSGNPDESIYIATQIDYKPDDFKKENPSEIANGKFHLNQMDNNKTDPIRNQFKRDAYLKHLQYYHELYTKIYEFNDGSNTGKMKQNTNFIKKSFNY